MQFAAVKKIQKPPLPDSQGRQQADLIHPENLVVLNVQYKKTILSQGLTGYGDMDRVLVPLGRITRILDFYIQVDDDALMAGGWFISEDRRFSLNLLTRRVIVDGRESMIPQNAVLSADQDIYVDAKVLGQWFPVDFKYEFHAQSLEIVPREKLPFQAWMDRKNIQYRMGQLNPWGVAVQPRQQSDHGIMALPVTDIYLKTAHESGRESSKGTQWDYTVFSRGDLGKMSGELFLSGDEDNGLINSRITLEQGDPGGGLLGPMEATHVSVGDVRVPDFPILSTGQNEIGGTIGNHALYRTRDFDTTRFQGNLPMGWDVEVYRNGNLVGSQRVEADGRYDFKEVSLFYGENNFELIFYGPQGQKKTEKKNINVGSEMLKKGESEYHLSVTAKDSTLIDPQPEFKTLDENTLRVLGQYEYGLSQQVSLGTGLHSQVINQERHDYLNAGMKGSLGSLFVSCDIVHDIQGGDAAEVFIQTGMDTGTGSMDLRFSQQVYSHFIQETTSGTNPLKANTSLSVSGLLENTGRFPDIPYTVSASRTQRQMATEIRLFANVSAVMGKTYFNNRLEWNDTQGPDTPEFTGQFRVTGFMDDIRLRGALDYELASRTTIQDMELSALMNPTADMNTEFLFKIDFENQNKATGGLRLNWDNNRYILSPGVSYNSLGEFLAEISITTSIGIKPRKKKPYLTSRKSAGTGMVSARVFHDRNNNMIFDQGDEPVSGVTVRLAQAHIHARTNEAGVAWLSGLPVYLPTDVVVEKDGFGDPFWEPSRTGVSVVPRPGHAELVEIPVVTTSEIEGTIYLKTGQEADAPMPNIRVQLLGRDNRVVDESRSEYDGFYLFMKVPPGEYTIRIHPDNARYLGVNAVGQNKIRIGTQGVVVSDQNMILRKIPVKLTEILPGPN